MCLHRLDALVPPDPPPPGSGAIATEADRDLLVRWWYALHGRARRLRASRSSRPSPDRIAYGGVLALARRRRARVDRGHDARGRRDGARRAGLHAARAPRARLRGGGDRGRDAAALDAGTREVLLFTDLANPTSNRLYRRLGYRPVEEVVTFVFAG